MGSSRRQDRADKRERRRLRREHAELEEVRLLQTRRNFFRISGAAAVGLGLTGLGYLGWKHHRDNSCLTWRPGSETWKPPLHEPPSEMEAVDKAIWLVKANTCQYSVDEFKRMHLQPHEVFYLVSHQLKVMPFTPEIQKLYLDTLEVQDNPLTGKKGIRFPQVLQGHVGQFADTLLRAGMGTGDFTTPQGYVTNLGVINENDRGFYPPLRLGLGNEDPTWLITAYIEAHTPVRGKTPSLEDLKMVDYLTYGLEVNPETGKHRYESFACIGLHFQDSLSRLHWYYGQYGKNDPVAKNLQGSIEKIIGKTQTFETGIERHAKRLIPAIEKFRDNPTKETFKDVFSSIIYLGHALEVILEPQGYYGSHYPLGTLGPAVQTLSEGIALWHSPQLDEQRKLLDGWEHYDNKDEYKAKINMMTKKQQEQIREIERQDRRYTDMDDRESRYSMFMPARLLNACHGLILWKEYKKQTTE